MIRSILSILTLLATFNSFSQIKKPSTPVKKQIVENLCNQIKKTSNDDGTFEMSPKHSGITLIRSISKGDTSYFASIEVTANSKFDNSSGVELFFAGKTLTFENQEIEVGANEEEGEMYIYKTFIKLSKYQLLMFMIYELKIVKVYVIDKKVETQASKNLTELAKCLF